MYIIYGTEQCPGCIKAKVELDAKSIQYTFIDITKSPELKKRVIHYWELRCKLPTVPLIQIAETKAYVGGLDDLLRILSS